MDLSGEVLAGSINFDLPDELKMLKDSVRRFVNSELIPIEQESMFQGKLKPEIKAKLEQKALELGLSNYDVPKEYGGLGLGLLARVVVWSELARSVALPSRGGEWSTASVSPILYQLNDIQKEKYLLPVIRREKRWCFCQTEPDAGGDPGSMRTTAVREGEHYIINGMKRFITGAGDADFAQVIAATDRSRGSHGGISAFLVDMATPGVKLLRQQQTMMDDRPWEIAFENVRVPIENRIGEEGDGFKLGQDFITVGRIRHAARAIGVIERCLELAVPYSKQRITFGKPLAERQAIQWMLVDSYMDLHQLRLMVYHAAWKYDRGEDTRNESYMAKIFGDTRSFAAADHCLTIHGGIGLTTDLPIEKFWRNQRSFMITEGPIEILKMALARRVFAEFD